MPRQVFGVAVISVIFLCFIIAQALSEPFNLDETNWRLVSFNTIGTESPVIQGSATTIAFQYDNLASGNSGCNWYISSYSANESFVNFEVHDFSRAACSNEGITAQEAAYLDAFRSATRYLVRNGSLLIWYGSGGFSFLKFEPIIESPLLGTKWQLQSLEVDGMPISVIQVSDPRLVFQSNIEAIGSGGCNGFEGRYVAGNETIAFSTISRFLMDCGGVGIMEQETAYIRALRNAVRYEMTSDSLTIWYESGGFFTSEGYLTFVPLEKGPLSE